MLQHLGNLGLRVFGCAHQGKGIKNLHGQFTNVKLGINQLQPRLAWAFGIITMSMAIGFSGIFLLSAAFDSNFYVRHANLVLAVILGIESARQSYR